MSGSETIAPNLFAPAISGQPTITGDLVENQTITAVAAPVTGTPAPARSWRWFVGGVEVLGETGSTLVLKTEDIGETVAFQQIETNSVATATATSAGYGPVQEAPFDPATLYGVGDTGLFLDFSNKSSMHTDLAGTVALTTHLDPIRSVNDLSGTGNRLNSQFTTTSPTYVESGGLAGAFYTASAAERLVRNAGVIGTPLGLSGVNEITVAIAFTSNTQANVLSVNSGGVGSSDDYLNEVGSVGQGGSIRNYSQGLSVANAMVDNTGFSDTSGAAFVSLREKVGTVGRHYRNGVLVETDTGLNDPWNAFFDAAIDVRANGGTIYAVLIITRALTALERTKLTDWLKAKAGIA